MYELVNKKNTTSRIVIGIVIFIFITAVLKIALHETPRTFNDDMIEIANNINIHAPVIVDSTIRFDRVDALHGNTFQYNYTLLTLIHSQVDTVLLNTSGRQSMIEMIKKDPRIAIFRDNNIELQAKYFDKNGDYVATVSIYPNEY